MEEDAVGKHSPRSLQLLTDKGGESGSESNPIEVSWMPPRRYRMAFSRWHLREAEAPVISCYLPLDQGRLTNRDSLKERIGFLRKGLTGSVCEFFDQALDPIVAVLAGQLSPDTRGVALFSRPGEQPLFVFLEFQTALQEWITAGSAPDNLPVSKTGSGTPSSVAEVDSQERIRSWTDYAAYW